MVNERGPIPWRALLLVMLRVHWPVLAVLVAFAGVAAIVPTMANVATTDDWAYSRAVETLVTEGRLVMYPVVAATAVGQVLWAAPFALIFGMSLGITRLSTVVAVVIGGVALYAILRQLGVSRSRSTLGMALYLFNPLTMSVAFTFMTDPHFVTWLLVSLACTLRGLGGPVNRPRAIVAGSIAAGFAFWVRQQGALIPVSVVLTLLLSRQLWFNWRSVRLLTQVLAAPVIMFLAYYAWLFWLNDVPDVQQGFLDRAIDEGWPGAWLLVRRISIFAVMYLGLFCLPLLLALVPARPGHSFPVFASRQAWWACIVALGVLLFAVVHLVSIGRLMPYIPQFLGSGGFGAADVPGGRQRVIEWAPFWLVLTGASLLGAVLMIGVATSRIGERRARPGGIGIGLVAMMALWQFAGVIPPSFQYINRGGSLDRYLLPLVPLTIVIVLWATRNIPLVQPVTWVAIAFFAVVSTAGMRDYLTYMDGVWDMAEFANEAGLPNDRLDAGSGWDGYHLYIAMIEDGVTKSRSPRGSPWWVYFYAKQTDSSYLVTTDPRWRSGYVIVRRQELSQWLEDDPVYIYLVRRADLPWPPVAE
jgi:4-amino-4-deoxy-L-arabinose transferase-like glycosyltransferase